MNSSHSNRIEILKSYLGEDPDDSFSNYALALEYMKINEDKLASGILEKILQRDEQYLAAYYQLGKIYEKISGKDEAASLYLKGIQIARQQKNQRTANELQSAYDSLINTEDE
jgi:tetratricopeptide (TPR) repeat protein